MEKELSIERVSLQPIELMKEAKELVGEQYWLFVAICFVALLIGSAVPFGILLGPMMCGLYLCYMDRHSQKVTDFNTLFKGFELFKESLIATLIVVGITMLIVIPLYIVFVVVFMGIMMGLAENAPALAFLLSFLAYFFFIFVVILVTVPFIFVYPLIAGHGLEAVPAVKASFQGVKENLVAVVSMSIAYTLIGMLAGLCCYFPAFLVMPLTFGGFFLAYTRIFPLEKSLPPAKA